MEHIIEGGAPNKGNFLKIRNKDKKGNESKVYIYQNSQFPDGTEGPVMLTEKEFEKVKKRAQKYKSDWIKKGWWSDLID